MASEFNPVVAVRYQLRNGRRKMKACRLAELADVMQRLYRRRLEAQAHIVGGDRRIVGQVWQNDSYDINSETKRPYKWCWWAEAAKG